MSLFTDAAAAGTVAATKVVDDALRAAVAPLEVERDAALDARAAAVSSLTMARADVTRLTGELTALTAAFEAYKAAHPGNPTEPPTQAKMLLGTTEVAYASLESLGRRMGIRRSYDGSMPKSVDQSKASADLAAGRVPWVSFTNADPATMAAFMGSCVGKGQVWVTVCHEVNNGPKMSPDAFRLLYADLAKARNTAGASNVKLVTILTAEPFRANTYQPYMPDPAHVDIVAADAYLFHRDAGSPADPKTGGLGKDRSMEWLVGHLAAYAASIGKPWALGEFGAHPFPSDKGKRPKWLRETVAWCEANGCVAAIYFHSGNGESGPWHLDRFHFPETAPGSDPDSIAAWRDLLTR